ncbi:MAG: hypothetical protein JNL63_10825 [Bacteroidia bacterium]|nr:hypothetical protein [Bacteroidia bacterium]
MKITKQQITGIVGADLLVIGLFLPVVNVPLMGDCNFFEVGNFNGLLDYSLKGIAYGIIGLGAASMLLSVLNYCRGLLITGLIAIGAFALTLKQFNDLSANLHDDVATNFLMNITNTTVDESNLRWGWIILFAGAVVLIVTSFLRSQPKEGIQ